MYKQSNKIYPVTVHIQICSKPLQNALQKQQRSHAYKIQKFETKTTTQTCKSGNCKNMKIQYAPTVIKTIQHFFTRLVIIHTHSAKHKTHWAFPEQTPKLPTASRTEFSTTDTVPCASGNEQNIFEMLKFSQKTTCQSKLY